MNIIHSSDIHSSHPLLSSFHISTPVLCLFILFLLWDALVLTRPVLVGVGTEQSMGAW